MTFAMVHRKLTGMVAEQMYVKCCFHHAFSDLYLLTYSMEQSPS